MNASFSEVQVRNDTDQAVIISRKSRLDMLGEYEQDSYFLIEVHHAGLAAIGWRN